MGRAPSRRARARTTRRCSPAARRPRPSCSTRTRRRSRRRCSSSRGCRTASCSSCGRIGATLGLGHIAGEIARRDRQGEPRSTVIGVKAILAAPLFLPFAVALLFGNLDAWYPLLYGALVLAAFPTSGRWTWLAAGAAVAVVAIAKLHPAVLGLWLARPGVRGPRAAVADGARRGRRHGPRDRRGEPRCSAGSSRGSTTSRSIRAGAGAELVDPRNLGPVSLLGQATGHGRPGAAGRAGRRDAGRGGRHRRSPRGASATRSRASRSRSRPRSSCCR